MAKTIRRAKKHQQRQTFAKSQAKCKMETNRNRRTLPPSERSERSRSPPREQTQHETKRRNTHEHRSTSSMSWESAQERKNNPTSHGKRQSPYDEPAIRRGKIRRGSLEQTQKRTTPIGRPLTQPDKTRHKKPHGKNEKKHMPSTRRWTAPRYDDPLTHMKNQFRCAELRARRNLIAGENNEEYRQMYDKYAQ